MLRVDGIALALSAILAVSNTAPDFHHFTYSSEQGFREEAREALQRTFKSLSRHVKEVDSVGHGGPSVRVSIVGRQELAVGILLWELI